MLFGNIYNKGPQYKNMINKSQRIPYQFALESPCIIYKCYDGSIIVHSSFSSFLAPPAERQRSFSNADSSVVRRRQLFT